MSVTSTDTLTAIADALTTARTRATHRATGQHSPWHSRHTAGTLTGALSRTVPCTRCKQDGTCATGSGTRRVDEDRPAWPNRRVIVTDGYDVTLSDVLLHPERAHATIRVLASHGLLGVPIAPGAGTYTAQRGDGVRGVTAGAYAVAASAVADVLGAVAGVDPGDPGAGLLGALDALGCPACLVAGGDCVGRLSSQGSLLWGPPGAAGPTVAIRAHGARLETLWALLGGRVPGVLVMAAGQPVVWL